jgi:molecular chaperone IbpA
MTRISALHQHLIRPSFVGFDNLFNEIERLVEGTQPAPSFPPHNILKVNDNNYVVELAVAGFGKDEIDIQLDDGNLIIKGEKKDKEGLEYVYRGIATRAFTKKIRLMETIEVRGAEFKDGILRIGLENVIPDHKKPRKIQIESELKLFQPKLLQEEVTV